MSDILVAFIGGSGLYNIDGISNIEKININTPFGNTSAPITIGKLNNSPVHCHVLVPTEASLSKH